MSGRGWMAVVCLVAGILAGAWGMTNGVWPVALLGVLLLLVFWYLAFRWMAGAGRPMGAEGQIKPAANAAWDLKSKPVADAAGTTNGKD